jgi:hypothetical protein
MVTFEGSDTRAPSPRSAVRTRQLRRRTLVGVALVVVVLAGLVIYHLASSGTTPSLFGPPPCRASSPEGSYGLSLDQAANATTIAAVGEQLGLPDHAVTVALAAALQESQLHNLAGGDRDSSGLFQQRPSQGWGTPAQIQTPRLAAQSFYQHLAQVGGWETMTVAEAAQAVQRSADGSAYADWESEARVIATVLTGEVPAGFTCKLHLTAKSGPDAVTPNLTRAMALELGSPATGTPVTSGRGWQVSSWLVGHAAVYGITSVTFDGQRWTPGSGAWRPSTPAALEVAYTTR